VIEAAVNVLGDSSNQKNKKGRRLPPVEVLRKKFLEKGNAALKELRIVKRKKQSGRNAKRPAFTPLQKAQFQLGYNEGWRLVFDENGQVIDDDSQSVEICFAMWWFWPELKFLRTTREIHQWLGELSPTHFGIKSVESVCTRIGFFKGRRKNRASDVLVEVPDG
jgi:hypothetical protein